MDRGAAVIRLLGRFEVIGGDERPVRFPTQRSGHLLALLILEKGRILTREEISERLWPDDPSNERNRLNTELWRMRKALRNAGEAPEAWIASDATGMGFIIDPAPITVDVHSFDARSIAADAASDSEALVRLDEAAELYGGDLMPACHEDWCALWREIYRSRFLDICERRLALLERAGDWHRLVACARTILTQDPLLEHVHRELMRGLFALGDRGGAVDQYRKLKKRLREDLAVDPMDETRALFEAMIGGAAPIAGGFGTQPRTPHDLRREIDRTRSLMDSMARQLDKLRAALDQHARR